MKWLATLLIFGGYILIYAATANGGKFATEPWAGLFSDAYLGDPGLNPQAAGVGNLPPSAQNALHGTPPPPQSTPPQSTKIAASVGNISSRVQNALRGLV